jgi:sucrose-6-phosphate hydrolase SacC (GH32 family)
VKFPVAVATVLAPSRRRDLHLIVDRISVEAFALQGTIAMTNLIFPASAKNRIVFFSDKGKPKVKGELWELKSIWR